MNCQIAMWTPYFLTESKKKLFQKLSDKNYAASKRNICFGRKMENREVQVIQGGTE